MAGETHLNARLEFLTDSASYFSDKKEVYLEIKDQIALHLDIPTSLIRICGSAYWSRSYLSEEPFRPSESDLDVAIIHSSLFVRCLSEVRSLTRNFSNLTYFRGAATNPVVFQDYAYKKGMIRVDLMPRTRTKKNLDSVSELMSRKYVMHFASISFVIYDSEDSFTVKQISSTAKFRG